MKKVLSFMLLAVFACVATSSSAGCESPAKKVAAFEYLADDDRKQLLAPYECSSCSSKSMRPGTLEMDSGLPYSYRVSYDNLLYGKKKTREKFDLGLYRAGYESLAEKVADNAYSRLGLRLSCPYSTSEKTLQREEKTQPIENEQTASHGFKLIPTDCVPSCLGCTSEGMFARKTGEREKEHTSTMRLGITCSYSLKEKPLQRKEKSAWPPKSYKEPALLLDPYDYFY